MMKKSVVPRMMGLLVVYCVVFALLVSVQFAKKGNFTRRVGPMLVSGQYRLSVDVSPAGPNGYPLTGAASVSFGGVDFRLDDRDGGGFALIDSEGKRRAARPESVSLSGDTVRFHLPGGTRLVFSTRYSGGGPELWITGEFARKFADDVAGDVAALEIPFKPMRSSMVREAGYGQLNISYNGIRYQFSHSAELKEGGRLILRDTAPAVCYRALPEQRAFNPGDFVLSPAKNAQSFGEAISRWKDREFTRWRNGIAAPMDEDTVIAVCAEAVRRDVYRSVVASAQTAFLSGDRRFWESSVYLGGMEQALRLFSADEQEKRGRISLLIGEQSPKFLEESHVFELLSVRGYTDLIDAGLAIVRSMDDVTMDTVPGIFEGYTDLGRLMPGKANPFERLIEPACRLVTEGIQRDQDRVLVFHDGGDTAGPDSAGSIFNLRLGKALWTWGETFGGADWAGLGRSLILSVIALSDDTGSAPSALVFSKNGESGETTDGRISAAKIYRLIEAGEYFPRAAAIGAGGIWAWTTAAGINAVQENGVLDISVSFPVGATHYMMIRGVQPFSGIMLYNTNWPMDSLFERYDSSGWMYFSREQTLVLKVKHRVTVEHIQIYYDDDE
jgi:hypothetical protein